MYLGIENYDPNQERQYVEMWEGKISINVIIILLIFFFIKVIQSFFIQYLFMVVVQIEHQDFEKYLKQK